MLDGFKFLSLEAEMKYLKEFYLNAMCLQYSMYCNFTVGTIGIECHCEYKSSKSGKIAITQLFSSVFWNNLFCFKLS